MINTNEIITDAQLIAAFEGGGLKSEGVRPDVMAMACRSVAEFAIALYIASEQARIVPVLEKIANELERQGDMMALTVTG